MNGQDRFLLALLALLLFRAALRRAQVWTLPERLAPRSWPAYTPSRACRSRRW
jgi:hypothetical protein